MAHDSNSRPRGRLVARRTPAAKSGGAADDTAPPRPAARDTWLATPADFDYTRTLGFLNPRTVPAMEVTTPARYVRTIWLDPGALPALAGATGAHLEAADCAFSGPVTLAIAPAVDGGGDGDSGGPSGRIQQVQQVQQTQQLQQHAPGQPARPLARTRNRVVVDRRREAPEHQQVDEPGGLRIDSAPHLPDAVRRLLVTRMFDLDADLDAFFAAVSRDRVLGPLVRKQPPLRLPQVLDPFEGLVRAVLGQQVSVKGATTMVDRLVRRFGSPAPAAPWLETPLMAFPRPDTIAAANDELLRGIGLTRAKAATLSRIAQAICSGRLDCVRLRTRDTEDTHATLVSLPGIGPWTASYVRMRALGDRDAFPLADLGVIKALDARGVPRDRHAAVAERWRPWRAYATLHLWESLSGA